VCATAEEEEEEEEEERIEGRSRTLVRPVGPVRPAQCLCTAWAVQPGTGWLEEASGGSGGCADGRCELMDWIAACARARAAERAPNVVLLVTVP
jgi:hypothetical protein